MLAIHRTQLAVDGRLWRGSQQLRAGVDAIRSEGGASQSSTALTSICVQERADSTCLVNPSSRIGHPANEVTVTGRSCSYGLNTSTVRTIAVGCQLVAGSESQPGDEAWGGLDVPVAQLTAAAPATVPAMNSVARTRARGVVMSCTL